jgi:LysM repeat protein
VTGGDSDVKKEESKETAATEKFYVVQKGDTLWSIALKHKTTVEDVRELNDLKNSKIRRGMKLRIK